MLDSLPPVLLDTQMVRVAKVEGQVFYQDQLLLPGMDLPLQPLLRFSQPSDFVIVFNHRQQFQISRPDTLLQHVVFQALALPQLARPGKILNLAAFRQYLKGRKILALDEQVSLEVGAEAFPLDSAHFFFIQYRLLPDTTERIPKRLPYEEQKLLIILDSLAKVDGHAISIDSTEQHQLFYYDVGQQIIKEIGPIQLVFPDEVRMQGEVRILLEYLGRFTPFQDKVDFVEYFLSISYGIPEPDNLLRWLKTNFE
ncbi:MAG: hypothetical protein AAGD05_05950 [Bacteroidota bacterium]